MHYAALAVAYYIMPSGRTSCSLFSYGQALQEKRIIDTEADYNI